MSTLQAVVRTRVGKGASRAARRENMLPGVIYGNKQDPISISVDPKVVEKQSHYPSFFTKTLTIQIDKDKHMVLPRAVQFHPVTDRAIHIDFLRVSKDTTVHIFVPIHFRNEDKCPGIKRGGILNVVHHEVEVVCSATNIPQGFEIDLEGFDIGKSFHADAIALPKGVTLASDEVGYTVATLIAPSGLDDSEEGAEATEEESAEEEKAE